MRSSKFLYVEIGRGIAASLVVFFHSSKYYFLNEKYWPDAAWYGFFKFGHAGVEFFFVLSGFIIMSVHGGDVGDPSMVRPFLKKRIERIYPLFWAVLIVTMIAFAVSPGSGEPENRNWETVVQSILLFGEDPFHTVVLVSWSLWHEMLFYVIFAILIGFPKLGIPLILFWMVICTVNGLDPVPWPLPDYSIAFINTLFGLGMISAIILKNRRVPRPQLVLCAGMLTFVGAGVSEDYLLGGVEPRLFYGLGSMLAILGAVELERSKIVSPPRFLVLLGSASYSVYLTHLLALTVLTKIAGATHLTEVVPAGLAFPALTVTAIGAGLLVHLKFEVPLMAFVRGIRWPGLRLK